jgi:hypothetical protein
MRSSTFAFSVGLISITLGTILAVIFVPDNVSPPEALFEPALMLALGLMLGPLFRVSHDPKSTLRVENILLAGIIYWLLLDPLQSAYSFDLVSNTDVELAFASIGAFSLSLWVGAAGGGWPAPRVVRNAAKADLTNSQLFIAIIFCFILGSFYFVWQANFDLNVIISSLLAPRFGAAWSREALGGWDVFIEHLVYFGYPLPALCVLLARRHSWSHHRVAIALVLTLLFVLFVGQSGGRRIIGMLVGSGLFCWIITSRQLRFKVLAIVAAGAAVLLVALQMMLHYRTIGWDAFFSGEPLKTNISHLHVDDNLLRLSQIVSIFPRLQAYAGLDPLIYVLVRPVPRVLWPEKPVDAGYDLAGLVGETGVSLTTSVVGELYAMYGLFSVVLGGLFMGRLASMVNFIHSEPGGGGKPIIVSLGIMVLFIALRAMQEFVLMSYAVLAWCFVSSFFSGPKRTRLAR